MNWCLLLLMDGRDEYHERSIASAKDFLSEPPHVVEVHDEDHELGFAGAIAKGWAEVLQTGAEWVFHLEADFTFNGSVPLDHMAYVLTKHPYLAQMALKRQPWNEEEKAAGGIVELHPEDFTQKSLEGNVWSEHRRYFTTNPSLYRTNLCAQGWPQVPDSEGIFTHLLLEDPNLRFAFWGPKLGAPLVEHIGTERAGNGY